MKKVYKVETDVDNFQAIFLEDEHFFHDANELGFLDLDGTEKSSIWRPPPVFILEPLRKRPDFYHFLSGGFALSARAMEVVGPMLREIGEFLPFTLEGQPLHAFNALCCYNCLDRKKTKFDQYGNLPIPNIYVPPSQRERTMFFDPSRLPEATLFKIPETRWTDLYSLGEYEDPTDEFKAAVEEAGLTGHAVCEQGLQRVPSGVL